MAVANAFSAPLVAAAFADARWRSNFRDRAALEARQKKSLRHFLRVVVPQAPRFRGLAIAHLGDLPAMDKAAMMDDFRAYNTRGIAYDEAMAVALEAERSRDFAPAIGDVTVGLSSGTSGRRGLFLVSARERLRWAGAVLARTLPDTAVRRILTPWMPPIRVAFFLRADSNLYRTIGSNRIAFRFFDLMRGVGDVVAELNAIEPDAIVAPPSVLAFLAGESNAGRLVIAPEKVLSVAEVLEERDARAVLAAFGCATGQLYQATEGFLGYTCERGSLHLNESLLYVETEWLDAGKTRFRPVITDFSRYVQLIVRYRLDDVLQVAQQPCGCGRAELTIASIEGRTDEIVTLPSVSNGEATAIFPDALRHAMALAGASVEQYTIAASGTRWRVAIEPAPHVSFDDACRDASAEMLRLCAAYGVRAPEFAYARWSVPLPGQKRRRITATSLPEGVACTS